MYVGKFRGLLRRITVFLAAILFRGSQTGFGEYFFTRKVQTSSKRFFGKNAKLLTLDKIQICVYAQYTLTALDSVMQYPDWLNAGYVMAIAGIWRGTPRPGQFMVLAAVRYLQVGYAQSIFRTMPPIPITIVTGFLGTRCSWA